VLEDVANELLSIDAAAADFGVVVTQGRKPWRYELDSDATDQLRNRLRMGQLAVRAGSEAP
jgi:hypothetical protein